MAPSGSSLITYTLLDNAPRGTFICRAIANSMGLKGQGQLVSGNTVVEKTDEEFSLQSASGKGDSIKVDKGLESDKFNIPERCLPGRLVENSDP